jgi:hypothetical protein
VPNKVLLLSCKINERVEYMKKVYDKSLVLLIVIIALLGATWFTSNQNVKAQTKHRILKLYGEDYSGGNYYSKIIDKETGCKYLVVGTSSNSGGVSITPMYTKSGMPLCK